MRPNSCRGCAVSKLQGTHAGIGETEQLPWVCVRCFTDLPRHTLACYHWLLCVQRSFPARTHAWCINILSTRAHMYTTQKHQLRMLVHHADSPFPTTTVFSAGAWCMVHGAWSMKHGAWCEGLVIGLSLVAPLGKSPY